MGTQSSTPVAVAEAEAEVESQSQQPPSSMDSLMQLVQLQALEIQQLKDQVQILLQAQQQNNNSNQKNPENPAGVYVYLLKTFLNNCKYSKRYLVSIFDIAQSFGAFHYYEDIGADDSTTNTATTSSSTDCAYTAVEINERTKKAKVAVTQQKSGIAFNETTNTITIQLAFHSKQSFQTFRDALYYQAYVTKQTYAILEYIDAIEAEIRVISQAVVRTMDAVSFHDIHLLVAADPTLDLEEELTLRCQNVTVRDDDDYLPGGCYEAQRVMKEEHYLRCLHYPNHPNHKLMCVEICRLHVNPCYRDNPNNIVFMSGILYHNFFEVYISYDFTASCLLEYDHHDPFPIEMTFPLSVKEEESSDMKATTKTLTVYKVYVRVVYHPSPQSKNAIKKWFTTVSKNMIKFETKVNDNDGDMIVLYFENPLQFKEFSEWKAKIIRLGWKLFAKM